METHIYKAVKRLEEEITGYLGYSPKKKTVKINLTQMGHGLRDIETEEDLNEVVDAFRKMLKEKMAENTVIKLY